MKPKGETKTNYVHKKRRYRELLYCFYTQKSFPLIKSWNIANLRFFVADCPEKNPWFWWDRNKRRNESYFFVCLTCYWNLKSHSMILRGGNRRSVIKLLSSCPCIQSIFNSSMLKITLITKTKWPKFNPFEQHL